jgi:transketolase
MRNKFATICADIVKTDNDAVILIGDISHYLLRDAQEFAPDRFFNIGICEQSTINVAAGMSLEGLRPIVHTIAPFVVERAYEQIKIGLGYQNTDVTIITVGGTYDYADLGCTHHCYSDIALMRNIPGMDVFEPGAASEFEQLFKQSWGNGNPKYFRLSNYSHSQNIDVQLNKINIVRESKNNKYVFVTGHLLDDVLQDPEIGVLYVSTLSNISADSFNDVSKLFNTTSKIFSVENHFINGGLGDLISSTFNVAVTRIGLPNKFITEYGSYEDLRLAAGMDTKTILEKLQA